MKQLQWNRYVTMRTVTRYQRDSDPSQHATRLATLSRRAGNRDEPTTSEHGSDERERDSTSVTERRGTRETANRGKRSVARITETARDMLRKRTKTENVGYKRAGGHNGGTLIPLLIWVTIRSCRVTGEIASYSSSLSKSVRFADSAVR